MIILFIILIIKIILTIFTVIADILGSICMGILALGLAQKREFKTYTSLLWKKPLFKKRL